MCLFSANNLAAMVFLHLVILSEMGYITCLKKVMSANSKKSFACTFFRPRRQEVDRCELNSFSPSHGTARSNSQVNLQPYTNFRYQLSSQLTQLCSHQVHSQLKTREGQRLISYLLSQLAKSTLNSQRQFSNQYA